MDRKRFLQSIIGASAFAAMPYSSFGKDESSINGILESVSRKTAGNLKGFQVSPIEKVRVGIIGLGNRGSTLIEMFRWLVENNRAEIVALSDVKEKKVSVEELYKEDQVEKKLIKKSTTKKIKSKK